MIVRLPKGFPCYGSYSLTPVPFVFADGNLRSYVLSYQRSNKVSLVSFVDKVVGLLFLVGISWSSFDPF